MVAAILSFVDIAATAGHPLSGLVADVDVAVGALAAVAVHVALTPAAVLLTMLARVGPRHASPWRRTAPSIALLGAACALNAGLLAQRPAIWLLVAGLPVVHATISHAGARPRWRVAAVALGLVALTVLLAVNGWTYRGVSPRQHATLVLGAWCIGVGTLFVATAWLVPAIDRSARAWSRFVALGWVCAVVFVVQSFVALSDAPAGAGLVLRETAPAARATLDGLAPLFELDGDGDASWPAGGDCAPFTADVAPSGPEIAGDGRDQNCLAGDPSRADVDALARVLAADGATGRSAAPATRLLLVTIDALRHDAELPQMEARIGDRCTKIDRAYSTNNETTFSMYSVFASRFPSQGVFTPIGPYSAPIDDPAPRLPGLLADAGFATMAIAFHDRFDPRLGLTLGFADVWMTESTPEAIFAVAGVDTTDRAIAWTHERVPPWMLWVHYYDPHEPYRTPDPRPAGLTPKDAYLGEVSRTDTQLARFLDELGPTLDEVALVVAADHGEAFGEHGVSFHGTDMFDEQIRIPMWVCPPRSWPRPPAHTVASLVDVAPTMLDFAGLPRPPSFVGRSLLVPAADVPVFAESIVGRRLNAAIAPPWKLVRYLDGDVRLLFDLERDPQEQDDRVGIDEVELARMSAAMDAWAGLVAEGMRR